ncbi:MAG: hypothetical protein GXY83_26005 [Rhodopirellula sp.]|nr:hypothetical protein [Rhodopirellula sp.]
MIAGNGLLFLCLILLGLTGLNGGRCLGILPLGSNPSQQVVESYLAEQVPADCYRIREWYPPEQLGTSADKGLADRTDRDADGGVAQRVRFVFYGPSGARQLDTVYWVKNGRVARVLPADGSQPRQML